MFVMADGGRSALDRVRSRAIWLNGVQAAIARRCLAPQTFYCSIVRPTRAVMVAVSMREASHMAVTRLMRP